MSEEDCLEELERRLEEAVRIRLISDVPLGALLSGGVDSSIIVALMARVSSQPVKTFSIGFEAEKFNEAEYARLVAERFGTDHHELILNPNLGRDADVSFRNVGRAFRRLLDVADVLREPDGAAACDGGVLGRRRRRVVCRIRPLPGRDGAAKVRSHSELAGPDLPGSSAPPGAGRHVRKESGVERIVDGAGSLSG